MASSREAEGQTDQRSRSMRHMNTCFAQVCCVSVSESPLGHQIMLLTSEFHAGHSAPAVYALVTGVGVQVPLGHARPAEGVRSGGSVAYELFDRPGRFAGIFVLPDCDCGPARRGEMGVGVQVTTGDATELQTPPAGGCARTYRAQPSCPKLTLSQ
jgi:hypothetical protein